MKRIFLVFLLLITSFSVFAFDFGGILSTTSYVQDPVTNLSFNQYVETTLWTRAKFGKNTTFSTELFYSFNGDFVNDSELQVGKNSTFTNKFDLSNLKVTSKVYFENGTMDLSVGRFLVNDFSGKVLAQKIDVAAFSFSNQSLVLKFYAGYTGLLNSYTVGMFSPDFVPDKNPFYTFAAPYGIANLSVKLPVLFASQNLGFEVYTALDTQDFSYNRIYSGISFDGPIYKSLYYAFTSTYQFNLGSYPEKHSWGNLTKAEISYFSGINSLILSANVLYVSDSFTPISSTDVLTDGSNLDSVFKTGFLASIKPIESLFLSLGSDFVFDVTDNNNVQNYKGFQYSALVRYELFDDVLLNVSASQLFYNQQNPVYQNQEPYLTLKAHIRISF
ncbi:MAG: hypothetical protein UH788_08675 [Treponemataceae bacterium]|nr:hypothetical protein [Treponemataceae bacterium]